MSTRTAHSAPSSSPSSASWRSPSRCRHRRRPPRRRGRLLAVLDHHHEEKRKEKSKKAASSPSATATSNQLTENPADTEPSFSPDGRTDRLRPRRPHLHGPPRRLRRAPPHQRRRARLAAADLARTAAIVLFERRAAEGEPANLYTVAVGGGTAKELTPGPEEDDRSPLLPRRQDDRLRPHHRPAAAAPTTTSTRSARAAPASPASPPRPGRRVRPALLRRRHRLQPRQPVRRRRRATPTSTR